MTQPSDAALAAAFRDWAERLIHKTPSLCTKAIEYGNTVREYVYDRARELDAQYQTNINSVDVDNGGDAAKGGEECAHGELGDCEDCDDDSMIDGGRVAFASAYGATPPRDTGDAVERVAESTVCVVCQGLMNQIPDAGQDPYAEDELVTFADACAAINRAYRLGRRGNGDTKARLWLQDFIIPKSCIYPPRAAIAAMPASGEGDSARLDWLARIGHSIGDVSYGDYMRHEGGPEQGIRAAIDAARGEGNG